MTIINLIMKKQLAIEKLNKLNAALFEGCVERISNFNFEKYVILDFPEDVQNLWYEAKINYIFGCFTGCAILSGAALEKALIEKMSKKYDESYLKIGKYGRFYKLIDLAYDFKEFDKKQKKEAHKIRDIRNKYVHINIDELSNHAVNKGIKIKSQYSVLTKNGTYPTSVPVIKESPEDELEKKAFAYIVRPKDALWSLKKSQELIRILFPLKTHP